MARLRKPATVMLVIVTALTGVVVFQIWWTPTNARHRAIQQLADAKSASDLTEAVGALGTVLYLPDNSWIAIHYNQTRGPGGRSMAVALDSEGIWFESNMHFSGLLGTVNNSQPSREVLEEAKRQRSPDRWPPQPDEPGLFILYHLYGIETAKDLNAARSHLQVLGFQRIADAPAPRLRGPFVDR